MLERYHQRMGCVREVSPENEVYNVREILPVSEVYMLERYPQMARFIC